MPTVVAPAAPLLSVRVSKDIHPGVLAPPSVASILRGLEKRGLSICLNPDGDGLRLSGPQGSRTEKVKATLKAAKPALIAYLREQQQQRQREERRVAIEARVALETEFGKDLVELGLSNEVDLLSQKEGTDTGAQNCAPEQPPLFPLPVVIYHEDPVAFWREWKKKA